MIDLDKLEAHAKAASTFPFASGDNRIAVYPEHILALIAIARAAQRVKCYANEDCMGTFCKLDEALKAIKAKEQE